MKKITEKQWLVMMQKIHLRFLDYLKEEITLIPKAIQQVNDRTRIHIKQLIYDLESIENNINIISLHRAKKESNITLIYQINDEGKPEFKEIQRKSKDKTFNNNSKGMYL